MSPLITDSPARELRLAKDEMVLLPIVNDVPVIAPPPIVPVVVKLLEPKLTFVTAPVYGTGEVTVQYALCPAHIQDLKYFLGEKSDQPHR